MLSASASATAPSSASHQKLLEESPSPAVDSEHAHSALCRRGGRRPAPCGYTGAGTLEFLRDPDGNLWFMEMNVRLQVEHAVSEMLTLVDLVKWQIRTAAGVQPALFAGRTSRHEGRGQCRIGRT